MLEQHERPTRASDHQVATFLRNMARGFKYADECEHCGGKKRVKQANGCSAPKKCPVCQGTGKKCPVCQSTGKANV